MAEKSKEEIDAKQAISPAGLGDQSVRGTSGPGSQIPDEEIQDIAPTDLEDKYLDGEEDQVAPNVRETHPNRNRDGKPQLDKPSYGGGH
ncbi:hypothetical protein [Larkinella arboricola]|uniref:Uncharacterized protein n=1 Tax=Larkinella arboricola TaxID=643671 RepID=A0A327WWU4_LARAB|nr:hypothetical protein [Larkinella arboricola]RAJ97781.1 hypothetical protein LX87_02686 [Larkinella arboricola]